jgi:hypothetical protein
MELCAGSKSTTGKPASFLFQSIIVPYPIESTLSGVGKTAGKDTVLWYKWEVTLPANFRKGNVLLHFGAVDWLCDVYVNGTAPGLEKVGLEKVDIPHPINSYRNSTMVWANGQNLKQYPNTIGPIHPAPTPLYRDPVYDGAADPVVIWNRKEKSWWMLYTQRRANADAADVAYCFGSAIGVASSSDHGQTWVYRGNLKLELEKGHNTFWAPDIVYKKGTYHLFVAYIVGVRNHWCGQAKIAHYISKNLWDWTFTGFFRWMEDSPRAYKGKATPV